MSIASWITLPQLSRAGDAALLLTRLSVGAFLIWGVWDNITSAEHMARFAAFLKQFGFPAPTLMAPLGVAVQFICGALFIAGFATRWAGLLCALNFLIAIVMVDQHAGLRAAYPAWSLVAIGLLLATVGPGRYAADARITPEAG
ncbi:DoxX family protein [Phenylobacterium sp. J426]|uniref:DoxX family protein n=1 Tax=Phenylobacterium sp. J426 TaxID=2898439 RepID=UPI002151091A|nr:DoxX family protein [Phenylobacterium sp. J426]MCR5872947.1 DoxX family protein [Phenylobacterium sp. J426]